jgi:hypothetical protein
MKHSPNSKAQFRSKIASLVAIPAKLNVQQKRTKVQAVRRRRFNKGIRKMRFTALVLIAALTASAASAQTVNHASMQQGLDMLQTELKATLAGSGVEVDVNTLSLAQVATIISNLKDVNNSADVKAIVEAAISDK